MSTYRSSQIYDCNLEWTFPSESFDYIHIRFLAASVADWGALFKEAYRCLKPGGYLESMEPSPHLKSDDGSVDPESAMAMWANIFVKGGKKSGRTWTVVDDDVQEKGMADAGFEKLDVTSFKVRTPLVVCRVTQLGNMRPSCLVQTRWSGTLSRILTADESLADAPLRLA